MNKGALKARVVAQLSQNEKQQIMELWNQQYPAKLAYESCTAFESAAQLAKERNDYFFTTSLSNFPSGR